MTSSPVIHGALLARRVAAIGPPGPVCDGWAKGATLVIPARARNGTVV
ncbi:hypothetical protein ACN28S_53075 [Cystobacter fuscus]